MEKDQEDNQIHYLKSAGVTINRATQVVEFDLTHLTPEQVEEFYKDAGLSKITIQHEDKDINLWINIEEWQANKEFIEYREYIWWLMKWYGYTYLYAESIAEKKYPQFKPKYDPSKWRVK